MEPSEHLALAKAIPEMDESWLTPGWLDNSQVSREERSALVDWLVQVTDYIELSDITTHLAVTTVDRVLQQVDFNAEDLQLLGVAGLLVAAKMTEDCVPDLDNLLMMAGNVHSKADLGRMELEVILALNWRIKKTTASEFLHIYSQNVPSGNKVVFRLARAILDMALTKDWYGTMTPSHLASSCLMASSMVLGKGWSQDLEVCTGHRVANLGGGVINCLRLLENELGEGVEQKHSSVLAKLDKKIGKDTVSSVIEKYIGVTTRSHKDSTRSCG